MSDAERDEAEERSEDHNPTIRDGGGDRCISTPGWFCDGGRGDPRPDTGGASGSEDVYVYVAVADGFPCKIGISINPEQRGLSLPAEARNHFGLKPRGLSFAYIARCDGGMKAACAVESSALAFLPKRLLSGHRHEWRRCSESEAIAAIERAAIENGVRLTRLTQPPLASEIIIRKVAHMPGELWQRIEDFRFERRIGSEAEAMRRLLELGLEADARAEDKRRD